VNIEGACRPEQERLDVNGLVLALVVAGRRGPVRPSGDVADDIDPLARPGLLRLQALEQQAHVDQSPDAWPPRLSTGNSGAIMLQRQSCIVLGRVGLDAGWAVWRHQ
jgi:hypothetical protein